MKLASLEAVVRALNEADVPFVVVGGLAVIAHGYGRLTDDLDLVVQLQPAPIRRLFAVLQALGYRPRIPVTAEGFADPAQRASWIEEKGMRVLNFHSDVHRETPIDVFVTEPFDFGLAHDAALREEIGPGVPVRFVALDTLLRMKREAGRPQDIADVAELEFLNRGTDQ